MNPKFTQLLATIFDIKPQEVNESLNKENVAKWDSLTHMDLINSIEKEYNVQLSMEDILEMVSVSNIVAILNRHGVNTYA